MSTESDDRRNELEEEGFVKIGFNLEQDADGWPPTDKEWVWARANADGTYEVDNSPWFARGVSAGDIVEAEADERGLLRFRRTKREAGHSTVRVIFLRERDEELRRLISQLEKLKCDYEFDQHHGVLAVHVPASTKFRPLAELLSGAEHEGRLGWETGHLSQVHVGEWEPRWQGAGGS